MVKVSMKPLLKAAQDGNYAIGAFNVNNMEQVQAIMTSAADTGSPVICQVSKGALDYAHQKVLIGMIEDMGMIYPSIPYAIHLDHGANVQICKRAIELGCSSVMMDGSLNERGEASDYAYNVKVTKEVVEFARFFADAMKIDLSVEGEIGNIKGPEEGRGLDLEKLTKPDEARRIWEDTGIDALAIAWGTSHGAYKGLGGKAPEVRPDIVDMIHQAVPGVYLVSHGSSCVPKNLVDKINSYGAYKKYLAEDGSRHLHAYGQDFNIDSANPKEVLDFLYESMRMPLSVGVKMEDLQEGIRLGIRKVNIDTDSRMAMTGAILDVFERVPKEFDPRKYLGPARDAIKSEFAINALEKFGCIGKAKEIMSNYLR